MKKTYTVEITKGEKKTLQKNVYRLETDMDMNGRPIIITFDDVMPVHYELVDGTVIKFTEENVKMP